MATKRPKKNISLEEKYKIVKLIDANVKRKDIMKEFDISHPGTLTNILKKRETIVTAYQSGHRLTALSLKRGKFNELEQEVAMWVNDCNEREAPLPMDVI